MRRELSLLAAVLAMTTACGAMLVPTLDVWDLLARSDEVWRGEVIEVVPGARSVSGLADQLASVQRATAKMRVDRVVKGRYPAGSARFEFELREDPYRDFNLVGVGEYVLVFLSRREGTLEFTDGQRSKMDVPPPGVPDTNREGEASEQVSSEEALTQELVRVLASDRRDMVVEGLRQLAESGRTATAPEVAKLSTSSDSVLRGEAFATLMMMGKASAIPACIDFLKETVTNPDMEFGQIRVASSFARIASQHRLSGVAQAYTQETGTDLTTAMEPLLRHKLPVVRMDVISALRELRKPSSIPAFIQALDDESSDVRAVAVHALAFTIGKWGDWAPPMSGSPEAFQRATSLWKGWWEKEGKPQYAPAQ